MLSTDNGKLEVLRAVPHACGRHPLQGALEPGLGNMFAIGSEDGQLCLYDMRTLSAGPACVPVSQHSHAPVYCAAWNPRLHMLVHTSRSAQGAATLVRGTEDATASAPRCTATHGQRCGVTSSCIALFAHACAAMWAQ